VLGIAREAMEYLQELPWAGNVRELRSTVEAAAAQARHAITVADVRDVVRGREVLFAPREIEGAGRAAKVTRGLESRTDGAADGVEAAAPSSDVGRRPDRAELPVQRPRTDSASQSRDEVFGSIGYRELTAAYFNYLVEKTGGRLSEVARLAGISKATAYEWKERYGVSQEPAGEQRPPR
jgi:DNA-binding NtrC family response regulator